MRRPGYEDSVFINCPFDDGYAPLFRAIVFTVLDCGFAARCALEAADSGEVRISRIKRIISECRLGIHDISRTQSDRKTRLPRFNMPLELGLFLGAQEFGGGRQKDKQCLILDREPHRYQKFCSDIAGQDIRAHGNNPDRAIREVRNTLATFREPATLLAGPKKMVARFQAFQASLPEMCRRFGLDEDDLQFVELRTLAEEWVDQNRP